MYNPVGMSKPNSISVGNGSNQAQYARGIHKSIYETLPKRRPHKTLYSFYLVFFFIGPESDHCLPLSVTEQVTHSCLVDFIDVTLAFEDANSKHVVLKSILLYKVQLFQKHLLAAVLDEVK